MLPEHAQDPTRTVYYPGTRKIRTSCLIAPAVVQAIEFPADSILGFNEEGKLWRCRLGANTNVHGIPCQGETEIEFYPNGQLFSCYLSSPFTVSGCCLKEGTLALFHVSGELFRGILRDDLERQGYSLTAGTEVCLFEDGRLSTFLIGNPGLTMGDIELLPGSQVWFHADGRLKAGTLRNMVTLQGVACPAGSLVWFHPEGRLAGCASDGYYVLLGSDGSRRNPQP